ncbi:MAG: DNA pilot protein [Microviridae sp.]|nr:MAG: DNA pilot protein [Microviridae sp.]
MPIPFAAFLPLIGSALGAASTVATNSAQRRTNLEIYDRQRADALADYNKNNQYNSPKEQMARFKEAGLNPHLIYGQTNTAQPVRSTDAKAPNYVAPQLDMSPGTNPLLIQAQIDNIKANTLKANSETDWKNLNTRVLDYRKEYIIGKSQWDANLAKSNQEKTQFQTYALQQKLKPEINQIIANTQLSQERKAQVSQSVLNLVQSMKLMEQRTLTEQQQNEFVKKVDSISKVGGLGIQLLRLLFK